MPSLVHILLRELDARHWSEEERLQAIGQLRAGTWIAALSVIADIEGPTQAAHSLEALTQADMLLVILVLGWIPDTTGSPTLIPLTPNGRALHRRLVRSLGRWLARERSDPSQTVQAVEVAYRETLTRILRAATSEARKGLLAIHYDFRRTIIHTALELIETSSAPHRPVSTPARAPGSERPPRLDGVNPPHRYPLRPTH